MPPTGRRGYLLVLAAGVLWGTTGTAQALGPSTSNPVAVGAVRMAIGGGALVLLAVATRRLPTGAAWIRLPVVVAGLAMAAYQPFFFAGVSRAGVVAGTVVAIGSAPVMAGLLAALTLDERLSGWWAGATAMAVTGVVLLASGGQSGGADAVGLLLALAAGACYAVYAVAAKRIIDQHSPISAMAMTFGWAAVVSLPLLVMSDLSWLDDSGGLAMALYLGLIATAMAYVLFGRGLQVIAVGTAATLTLAEPATAAVLGFVVLDERLGFVPAAGLALLVAALTLLARHQVQDSGRSARPNRNLRSGRGSSRRA